MWSTPSWTPASAINKESPKVSDEALYEEDTKSPGSTSVLIDPIKGTSLYSESWKRLKKNKMAMAGLVVVVFYSLVALLAPLLPINSFRSQNLLHKDLPPSLTSAGPLAIQSLEAEILKIQGSAAEPEVKERLVKEKSSTITRIQSEMKSSDVHNRVYPFGTDYLGRDLLARVIYGGQISILIGLIGTLTSIFIGIVVGAVAGYMGGKVDSFLMRIVDILYGLPYMLLVIIFMAVFGQNIMNLFFALAVVSWLTEARVVRGQIISLKNAEFVEAAKTIGAGSGRIIFRHLLPNTLGVIIVFATLRIPSFIMMEAFLSFLGLGVSAPMTSWGLLVQEGVEGMTTVPWRLLVPAFAMTIFLFSMNFLGDGLRDAFDPQSKNN